MGEMLPALVNYYGGQRYGTVECRERLYADAPTGKARCQSHGEGGLRGCVKNPFAMSMPSMRWQ
ncbi:hypothetical protein DXA19_04785 [Firmicutes bacterium AM59-13]|nr:hypothetical protein DXA19_04785 [Firmicutes bacterium AM59-13]